MKLTTIQVKDKTLKALKKLKLVDRESYDSVLQRLIINHNSGLEQSGGKFDNEKSRK